MPPKAVENDRRGGLSWTAAWSLLTLIALTWIAFAVPIFAQAPPVGTAEPPMPPRGAAPATPMPPASPAPAAPVGENRPAQPSPELFALVKGADGTVLPLPAGTKYEDFMEWVASRRGPGYGVNSVVLIGRVANNELLELQAEVTIVVQRDEEWVRVPLGFHESVIGQVVQHEGEGESSYADFTEADGHAWFLRGRGEHKLILGLMAPLSTEMDDTHLTLATPANAAMTSIQLEFPTDVEVRSAVGVLRQEHATDETTTATWVGPGGQVDLTWNPRPETALPEDLTVVSSIGVRLNSQECELRVRQVISPAKGRISNLEVELPADFTFLSLEGDAYRAGTARVNKETNTVSVTLTEPQSRPVELDWRVVAPLREDMSLTLSDFSVRGVPEQAQSGEIKIERTTAYTVDPIESDDALIGLTQTHMVEPGPADIAWAYEYSSQPFSLEFKATPIAPKFEVSPELIFTIHPDRLDLDAKFGVNVSEGELKEMRFLWPAEGWNITRVAAGYIQEMERSTSKTPEISIQVPNLISFEIPILATMKRKDISGEVTIPLPRVESISANAIPSNNDRVVGVRYPNNYSVTVRAADGTPLEGADADGNRPIRLPEPSENEQMGVFWVPSAIAGIQVDVKRIEQEIHADTIINVRPRGETLVVEQRFDYGISYEPLSTLKFQVPEVLFDQQLQFVDGSGRPFPLREVSRSEGQVEVELPLVPSVKGQISLATHYTVPLVVGREESGTFSLPVIQPMDGQFGSALLKMSPLLYHEVANETSGWTEDTANTEEGQQSWTSSDALTGSIPLTLTGRQPDDIQQTTIAKLLLRSTLDESGQIHTVVDGLLDRPAALLVIGFPEGIAPQWFSWRGRRINFEATPMEGGGAQVALDLEEGSGAPVLSFEYRVGTPKSLDFIGREQIPAVVLGDDIAIGEVVWQVGMPESEHLLANPRDYVPRFEWKLDRGFWSRRTVASLEDVRGWFGADLTPVRPEMDNGHHYVFSRKGSLGPLRFSLIAKSLVVLVGAGMAILLGFTFANGLIPHPRYVLPGLVVVALLLWAFFPRQIQIFIQPAILGLVLVGIALIAERVLQQRQDRLNATASTSAVDFVTILPGDGSASVPSAGIGSEEPTVVRAGANPDSRS